MSNTAKPGNPGTRELPFSSPEKARDTVRALIAEGLDEPVTIRLLPGESSTIFSCAVSPPCCFMAGMI